jgi:hypothetical protein
MNLVLDRAFDPSFVSDQLTDLLPPHELAAEKRRHRERELSLLIEEKDRLEAICREKSDILASAEERLVKVRESCKVESVAINIDLKAGEEQLRVLEQRKANLTKEKKAAEAELSQVKKPWKLALHRYWKEVERIESDGDVGLL